MVDEPHGGFHGGEIAAPAFARIALPALQYLGVMPEEGGVVLNRGAEIQASLKGMESTPSSPRRLIPRRVADGEEMAARFRPLALSAVGREGGETTPRVTEMPDVSGRSLREATVLLASLGLAPRVGGQGPFVGAQSPEPGVQVSPGSPCTVTLTEERP